MPPKTLPRTLWRFTFLLTAFVLILAVLGAVSLGLFWHAALGIGVFGGVLWAAGEPS